MFDIITPAPVDAAAVVVSHDNSAATATQLTIYQRLENLIVQREVWEDEIFRASNDRLYSILQDCYALYANAASKPAAKALNEALTQQANIKGLKFTPSAHTLTKIVKCVFGADRRRASAYSIALRSALSAAVKPDDLPAYIRNKGGVEEVRLARGNAMKPADKAVKAADLVANSELALVQAPAVTALLDTGKIDEFVVLLAQQGADGVLTIKALVQSKTVVDAALASVYSQNSKDIKNKAGEQVVADAATGAQQAIDAAVQSVLQA